MTLYIFFVYIIIMWLPIFLSFEWKLKFKKPNISGHAFILIEPHLGLEYKILEKIAETDAIFSWKRRL